VPTARYDLAIPDAVPPPAVPTPAESTAAGAPAADLTADVRRVVEGCTFAEPSVELGVLVSGGERREQADRDRREDEEARCDERPAAAPRRPATRSRSRSPRREERTVVEQVVSSTVFRQFARSAGREIVRGLFSAARRR